MVYVNVFMEVPLWRSGGNHPVLRLVQKALYPLSLSLAPELCLYSYFKMIGLVGIGIFVF